MSWNLVDHDKTRWLRAHRIHEDDRGQYADIPDDATPLSVVLVGTDFWLWTARREEA